MTDIFLQSVTRKFKVLCLWWRCALLWTSEALDVYLSLIFFFFIHFPNTGLPVTPFRLFKSLLSIDTAILKVFYGNDMVQPALTITDSLLASCGYLPSLVYNNATAEASHVSCQPLQTICMLLWEMSSLQSCSLKMFQLFPVLPVLIFNLFSSLHSDAYNLYHK